jgi:hypothetical protein
MPGSDQSRHFAYLCYCDSLASQALSGSTALVGHGRLGIGQTTASRFRMGCVWLEHSRGKPSAASIPR